MNKRYVIGDKIGQGGLGEVYRSYDSRMNREVAVKRISIQESDTELREESTRQLIKEAGALASLQHPHIVTVYDVDSDEEGPYVVMELISGKTLDELIDNAPLTWPDFRELALQTEEALIAAHELSLIHSDIKPSNLMLTWLPSGKFQVKIVDFGLATLLHAQPKEDLDEAESVYGSIFFMAPEQFERVPIDFRTDLYAMGCVYYQALTGSYPFNGETGKDVMVSHLHHHVIPIQQIRDDIPLWACDWIMWHLNRQPTDRPESAREALHLFLQNDKTPNPPLSQGKPPAAAPRSRPMAPMPRRVGAVAPQATQPPATTAEAPRKVIVPQPLLPPEGSKPSIYNAPTPTEKTAAIATPQEIAKPQAAMPQAIKPRAAAPKAPTPQAATPQAATPQAATPQAATPQAATPQAAMPQAAMPQAAMPQAAMPQAAMPRAVIPRATMPRAAIPQAIKPQVAVSQIAEPQIAEPQIAEPQIAEPQIAEPQIAEPQIAEPQIAEPQVAEPQVAEPQVATPRAAMPRATMPRPPMPQAIKPQAATPQVAEPQVAEPQAAEPQAAEPQVAEPQVAEPQVAEPQFAEPQFAEPQFAEPQVAEPQAATPRAAMPRATMPRPPMPQAIKPQAATPRAAAPEPVVPQTDELQSDELQSDELQTDELQTDELQTDELQSDELQSDELQTEEPQVVEPQVATPQVATPRAAMPRATMPRAAMPQAIKPQVATPRAAAPEPVVPQTEEPQTEEPQVVEPQVVKPQAAKPPTAKPQTGIPQTAKPQGAKPVVLPKTIKPKGSFQLTHRLKLIIAASVAGCLLVGGGSFALYKYSKANESAKRHQKILEAVASTGTHEIPMSATEFAGFIDEVITTDTDEKREAVFRALALAKPNDGSDFETRITEFATKSTQILPELREAIFRAVIAKRATPAMVPALTEFARTSNDANSAAAAMRAMRGAAGDGQFETFLAVVQYHPNAELRTAAVESAEGILSRSKQRPAFAKLIANAVSGTANQKIRESLVRLQTAASQP